MNAREFNTIAMLRDRKAQHYAQIIADLRRTNGRPTPGGARAKYLRRHRLRDHALRRRLIAMHEAGHVVAARHFGVEGVGSIWLRDDVWEGHMTWPEGFLCDSLSQIAMRTIAVAGATAELLWLDRSLDRVRERMSRVDVEMAGQLIDPGEAAEHAASIDGFYADCLVEARRLMAGNTSAS